MTDLPWPQLEPFSLLLKKLRERMSPEVKQAVLTIVDAIFEEPVDATPAAAGVDKRRNCRSTSVRGERCRRHGSHSGDHLSVSGRTWHPAQRVKKKRKAKRK